MCRDIIALFLTIVLWGSRDAVFAKSHHAAGPPPTFVVLAHAGSAPSEVSPPYARGLSGLSSRAVDADRSIPEKGLTVDAILAWIVLGALAGSVVGSLFTLRRRGFEMDRGCKLSDGTIGAGLDLSF